MDIHLIDMQESEKNVLGVLYAIRAKCMFFDEIITFVSNFEPTNVVHMLVDE